MQSLLLLLSLKITLTYPQRTLLIGAQLEQSIFTEIFHWQFCRQNTVVKTSYRHLLHVFFTLIASLSWHIFGFARWKRAGYYTFFKHLASWLRLTYCIPFRVIYTHSNNCWNFMYSAREINLNATSASWKLRLLDVFYWVTMKLWKMNSSILHIKDILLF